MATTRDDWKRAVRGVRPGRVAVLLAAALLAGLVRDWLGSGQRLVFPRPLPEFRTTPPPR